MTRTNVVLNEVLVGKAKNLTGFKTTKDVVNYALSELLRHRRQKEILKLRGAVHWEGDLESLRAGRVF